MGGDVAMKQNIALLALLTMGAVTLSSGSSLVTQQSTKTHFFTGIVLAVDPVDGLLSIEQASLEAPTMTFRIQSDTKIKKGSARLNRQEAIDLSDIRVGDPVTVEYEESASGALARPIAVRLITSPVGI
jgi:hypothetical protein